MSKNAENLIKRIQTIFILMLFIGSVSGRSGFTLIGNKSPKTITIDTTEACVVKTAVDLFISDFKNISSKTLSINTGLSINENQIVIGTLGKSRPINQIVKQYHINTKYLKGSWEAFSIQVIGKVNPILVVLGSNDRGTAFGVMELSRIMGVSPWNWWADVKTQPVSQLVLHAGYINNQKPSVAYRGIFLNDEDWGLMPWSSKNFEPSKTAGTIGPKTYEKIFELLLRLRANTLWPAMHECTIPFFLVKGNKEMAEKYGISVGSSHCEPMNRNSLGEWQAPKSDYNYVTNRDNVKSYWLERIKEVAKMNTIFTLGIRGVHDSKMQGANTIQEQKEVLTEVIADQRLMIKQYVNSNISDVPQTFIPYKEVLDIYNDGLKVPDDVSLIWCDDNYGYITRLSNSEEQKRSGGSGVYYHVSYWGRPHDYLWLASTAPALMKQQMNQAWNANARKIWILNVGDLKPAEYLTEYFLDLAWDYDKTNQKQVNIHLEQFMKREFGSLGNEITNIMQEYYTLAYIRKPEFMGWNLVEEGVENKGIKPVVDTEYNPFVFGDELQRRINQNDSLEKRVKSVSISIPENRRSAFFELVEYPVCGASLLNKKLLYAQKARLFAKNGLDVALMYKELSNQAYYKIQQLTKNYNQLENGKWNEMMDMEPRSLPVFQKASMEIVPDTIYQTKVVLWVENDSLPLTSERKTKLQFTERGYEKAFIEVFKPAQFNQTITVLKKPDWLDVEIQHIFSKVEDKIVLTVNWEKVVNLNSGTLLLGTGDKQYAFDLSVIKTTKVKIPNIEGNNYVTLNNKTALITNGVILPNLGYRGNIISLEPNGSVAYEFYTVNNHSDATIMVATVPNHPTQGGDIRYAISLDGNSEQIVSFKIDGRSEAWKLNVLSNQARTQTTYKNIKSGIHKLIVRALDPFVMVDQVMINFERGRKFYEIP